MLNLILLFADDLRPELSIYGRRHVVSPNFEQLESRSFVFDRAYSQIPVCFPSRFSMLTGLRPDKSEVTGFFGRSRRSIPTIYQILISNG